MEKKMIREIAANLKIAALNLGDENKDEKREIIRIAQELGYFDEGMGIPYGDNLSQLLQQGIPEGQVDLDAPQENEPSQFGIDRKPGKLYNITIDFLHVNGTSSEDAQTQLINILKEAIPELAQVGRMNVLNVKGVTIKEPN